jgi:hypothetical protein
MHQQVLWIIEINSSKENSQIMSEYDTQHLNDNLYCGVLGCDNVLCV